MRLQNYSAFIVTLVTATILGGCAMTQTPVNVSQSTASGGGASSFNGTGRGRQSRGASGSTCCHAHATEDERYNASGFAAGRAQSDRTWHPQKPGGQQNLCGSDAAGQSQVC